MRILICKPNSYLTDELTEYFSECNWESDIACDPGAIYRSLSQEKYDFTLYYVSSLDDFATIRYINTNYPGIKVVVTSDVSLGANIENVRQGAFTTLKLPYHLNQLQELITGNSVPSSPAPGSRHAKIRINRKKVDHMKKLGLLILLFLVSVLFAQNTQLTVGNAVNEVKLRDVVEIGNRNAAEQWGITYPAEPIPYYGPDDEIIAYHLNYSIKGTFPDKEVLKSRCDAALTANRKDVAWGVGDYGNMVIGAKPYMPVFIQSSLSLSEQYAYGRKLERAAHEAFPQGYTEGKTYYLGYVNVWHQVSDKTSNKYINLMPTVKIISEEEFSKLKSEIVYFWTTDTFEDEWQKFMVNRETMGRGEVFIPGEELMPFYEWSYGCTPSAATMLLAWWDHYKGMGRFISSHYERYDPVVTDTDYHVPTLQHEMAQAMDTGDGGTTYLGDVIDAFYEVVENHGYRCVCDGLWAPHHTDTTLYNDIKDQINQGLPCLVGIWGHTITGVGYNTSPKLVYIHDSNHEFLMQIHKSFINDYFYVYVYDDSGNHGIFMELTDPNGSTNWSGDLNGEYMASGGIYEITWDSPHANTTASLEYSVDAGEHWAILETTTENDGSYCWLVPEMNPIYYPDGITNKARVGITVYDHNDELIAADGSYGNFHIVPGGSFPFLTWNDWQMGQKKFAKIDHDEDYWGVVYARNEDAENRWSVELFDDQPVTDFENSVMFAEGDNATNYIVIDNRTLAQNVYGVKFNQQNPEASYSRVRSGFRNGHQSLALGTNSLIWSEVESAKIWDLWLEPGNHYFQMDVEEDTADLDFAMFKSGGSGMFNRGGAVASSEHYNLGGSESFLYTVEQAGYYAILVTPSAFVSTDFTILISDSSVWTGALSTSWHDAGNWQPQVVPGPNHAVVIPAGRPRYPEISSANSPQYTQCKSLLIKSGANIILDDRDFEVVGNMQVFGKLQLLDSTSEFLVSGDITWENRSTIYFGHNDATLLCYRDWTAKTGSYFTAPFRGTVKFISYFDSHIKNYSSSFNFPDLIIEKLGGASAIFDASSTQDINVEGHLIIENGSVFESNSDRSIVIKGSFANRGSFTFDDGTVRLIGQISNISCPVGSYFCNLEISTEMVTTLTSDLYLKGDFILNSGGFLAGAHTMYVGGDWKNNIGPGGFEKGTSTVIFDGDGLSLCYGELFANLVIDNPDCQLVFVEGESSIDSYTWVAGGLGLGGATLTINDMPSYGIYGNYYIGSGVLNIHQNANQPVDLLGIYHITNGTVNIYGGLSPSSWANADDLTLLMRGGVLDFKDVGILLAPSASTTMNIDITDGIIRTTGDFICTRTDFNPVGGSVELYGSGTANVSITSPSTFANLIINKDSRNAANNLASTKSTESIRLNEINLLTDLVLLGDLIIPMGTFNLCGKNVIVGNDLEIFGKLKMVSASDLLQVFGSVHWYEGSSSEVTNGVLDCYGDWNFWGGAANLSGSHTSVFKGDSSSLIHTVGSQAFANVSFAKTSTTYGQNLVTVDSDLLINGNLSISERSCMILSGSDMQISGTLTHQSSSAQLIPEGNTVVCNDLDLYGHLMVDGGDFTVEDDYYQRTGCQLSVEAGYFILDAPYTGANLSITGTVALNGGVFKITNEGIQFGASSSFVFGGGKLNIGWGLRALTPSTFNPTTGTIEFSGTRTATIELAAGNSLNNVALTKTGTGALILSTDTALNNLTINSGTMLLNHHNLQVNGNVNIVNGVLNAAFSEDYLTVYGDWTNSRGSAGFIEGSGAVFFNGSQASVIHSSETFNILELNKTLEVSTGATLTANSYQFITGVLKLQGGSTLNTPASGFVVSDGSGLICATDIPSTINLYGNFVDYSMEYSENHGFHPGASIVNVLGTGNRQIQSYFLKLNDLNINLTSGNCHINHSSPEFSGSVNLISGTLSAESGSSYTFYKSLSSCAGSTLALSGCYLNFVGSANAQLAIAGTSDYSNLTINKELGSSISLGSSLNMPAACTLTVQQGLLALNSQVLSAGGDVNINNNAEILVNANAQLKMPGSSTLNVNSGGKLSAIGTVSQPALISRTDASYYSLNVNSGGTIAAEYAIFEYTNYYGVNIYAGALVDDAQSFNNCTFRNGSPDGTLLYIGNEQTFTITGAVFPQNTWLGMSNVSKTMDSGSIRFLGESGAFSGANFESDPYSRINWNSQNPSIALDTNSLSFGDVFLPMSGYRSFYITNSGSGSLAGTLIVPDDFTANIYMPAKNGTKAEEQQRSSSLNYLVLPGSFIEVQVGFIPTQPITYNSTLVITHNASGTPVNVSLTGTGIGSQITVNPTQIVKGILLGGSHTQALSIIDSGNRSLSYYASIEYPTRSREVILSESFESATFPPNGWSTYAVNTVGTAGVWARSNGTVNPSGGGVQDGQYLAYFNSYSCLSGNQTRLQTGYLNFTGYSSVNISFWMYHNNRYSTSHDAVQIQISQSQDTWVNVGDPIDRVATVDGWQQHTISLSAYGNQNYLRLGFLGNSFYGDDIHIDNVTITGSNPPTNWVFFNGQSASVSNIIAPGATDTHQVNIYTDGMDPGTYQAEIHIASNDPITSIKVVPITVSIGNPALSVNPTYLSYSLLPVGSESIFGLYLTNTGSTHLNGSITVPSGYHVQPATRNNGLTSALTQATNRWSDSEQFILAPGAIGSYIVKFAPTAVQAYNGNIVISTDMLASMNVPVTGSGGITPEVQTGGTSNITDHSASLYGSIIDSGGMTITGKGFYYGTDPDPREYGERVLSDSSGNSFNRTITGLDSSTQYFYCAFADNYMGTGVGEVFLFNTTGPVLNVSATNLPDFGNVQIYTSSPQQSFTISGYGLTEDVLISVPTGFRLALPVSRTDSSQSDTQIILSPVGGAIAETTINVFFQPIAVAPYSGMITISTAGIADKTITVSGAGVSSPTISTVSVSAISAISAVSGGTVISDGGFPILSKGVCWSLLPNPDTEDAHTADGAGTTSYGSNLSPLLADSFYYARAYATYASGIVYGNELVFTTLAESPASAPENPSIQINGDYIVLSWDPVPNATSYKVLSSTTPEGIFAEDFSGVFGSCTWSAPITRNINFYQVKAVGGSSSKFVSVPAGTYTMGRTSGTGDPDELPTHAVTLSAFQIGKYEVTQAEWANIMGTNPASGYGVGDLYPVYNVSWYSVIKYCNLRSLAEGLLPAYSINGSPNPATWGTVPVDFNTAWDNVLCNWNADGYRLPTEAEWEYAARGATNSPDYLYAGSNDINAVGWYYNDGSPAGNKPIGGKSSNALGLYDLSGNANELCWDLVSAYSAAPVENPTGGSTGYERIRRGGFWNANATYSRVVQRDSSYPFIGNEGLGFRLCRSGTNRQSSDEKP